MRHDRISGNLANILKFEGQTESGYLESTHLNSREILEPFMNTTYGKTPTMLTSDERY